MNGNQHREFDLGLARAAQLVPGRGRAGRKSRFTLVRWLQTGVRVGNTRVRLGGAKVGGTWFTSAVAVERFIRATTAGAGVPAVLERTPAERDRASCAASAALAAAGW